MCPKGYMWQYKNTLKVQNNRNMYSSQEVTVQIFPCKSEENCYLMFIVIFYYFRATFPVSSASYQNGIRSTIFNKHLTTGVFYCEGARRGASGARSPPALYGCVRLTAEWGGSAPGRLRRKNSSDLGVTAQSCPRQHTERARRRRRRQRWTPRLW